MLKTTDPSLASRLVQQVMGNYEGRSVYIELEDLRALLGAGTGRFLSSWARLQAITGTTDAEGARVDAADTGTHLQLTATGYDGAEVPNAGNYSWNAAFGGWEWVSELSSAAPGTATPLQPADQPGVAPDLFSRTGIGAVQQRPPLQSPLTAADPVLGTALRVIGADTIWSCTSALVKDDVVEISARLRRVSDPTDPTGDRLALVGRWLDADFAPIGPEIELQGIENLRAIQGERQLSLRVSGISDISADLAPPTTAKYLSYGVRQYGLDAEMRVSVLRALNVTQIHLASASDNLAQIVADAQAATQEAQTASGNVDQVVVYGYADAAARDLSSVGAFVLAYGAQPGRGGGVYVKRVGDTSSPQSLPELIVSDDGSRFDRVEQEFEDRDELEGSSLEAAPDETIVRTKRERYAYSVDSTLTTPHLLAGGVVKLRYEPGAEVDAMAFKSAADGGDISPTLFRAAQAYPGHLLRLPPGNYSAGTTLDLGGLSSSLIRADAASITVEANVPFIRIDAPVWEDIQSIAPISADGFWGPRAQVAFTDASSYAAGDLVKIVSDDRQRGTRPGDGTVEARRGFMAYLLSKSGNVGVIDRPVPWSFTTNPRIGRMPPRRFNWSGGLIQYEAGHEDSWTGNAMLMTGVSDVDIKAEFGRAYNATCRVLSCMNPRVNVTARGLENDQNQGQFGYVVSDGGQGMHAYITSGRNRHGYTTSQPQVAAGSDDLHQYGPAYGARVEILHHGESQAGGDTHHGSERITFVSPVVSGCTEGGAGIVIRGIGHRVITPNIYDGENGIYVYDEDEVYAPFWRQGEAVVADDIRKSDDRYYICTTGGTTGATAPTGTDTGIDDGGAIWDYLDEEWNSTCEIIDPKIEVDHTPIRFENGGVASIRDGTLRSLKYGTVMRFGGGDVRLMGNIEIRPGGQTEVANRRAIEVNDARVDARNANLTFDLQDIPAGVNGYGLVEGGGDVEARWKGGRLRSINDADLSTAFYKRTADAAVCNFGGGGLELITEKVGANPDTVMGITGAAGVGFTGAWSWRTEDGNYGTHQIYQTLTEEWAPTWRMRSDRIVVVRVTTGGSYNLGVLPDGTFVGQVMMISCAGGTVTLRHGATFKTLLGGIDIPLTSGDGVTLVWNGSNWLRVAV